MAKRGDFQMKSEILRNLMTELLCHNCKNAPIPYANGSNRYQCTEHGQYLCEDCKNKSICSTSSKPSPIVAKLLDDLPWFCCNFVNGCKEVMWEKYLKEHQQNCPFRVVPCPQISCKKKIIFKDAKDHVNYNCIEPPKGLNYFWDESYNVRVEKVPFFCRSVNVGSDFLLTSFCVRPNEQDPRFFLWVYFYGPSCQVKNYIVEISSEGSRDEPEILLRFPAFGIGEDPMVIWKTHPELSISEDVMKRLAGEKGTFKLSVNVKNMKEEAKDEDNDSGCTD